MYIFKNVVRKCHIDAVNSLREMSVFVKTSLGLLNVGGASIRVAAASHYTYHFALLFIILCFIQLEYKRFIFYLKAIF